MGCLMLPSHLTLFNAMERMSPLSHSHWEMYNLFLVKNCAFSLPSATKLRWLCFYRCVSVHGGGGGCYPSMHCCWYPSMPCSRSQGQAGIPTCHTQGGSLGGSVGGSPGPHPRGKFGGCVCLGGVPAWGGACSRGCLLQGGAAPGGVALCCGLLVCPSVMAFWFGGLLIEGGLLVWSSGGGKPFNQKAITEDTTPEGHTPEGLTRSHTRRP